MYRLVAALAVVSSTLTQSASAAPRPMGLVLPTKNRALFTPHLSQYYMYTNRNFEGRASKPWTGG